MKKLLSLVPAVLGVSVLFYAGCSGGDEPKPFDCNNTDLVISLATNGDVDPTSCSANDGTILVAATGGKEPYKFAIGTEAFANSALFSNLGPGTFSISVQDANKCTKKFNVTLVAPGAPTVELEKTQDTNCTAPFNGTITVNASGGSGTYQYKLDAGGFGANPVFQNVKAGSHTIVVKDEAECIVTVTTSVSKGITGINYVDDILPIFESKCQFPGCHPDNGDWFTYSVAKNHAGDIKGKTASGAMPKGGTAAPGGALSASQIARIACWVDDGAPQN
jgi:SprB repeat